LLIEDFPFLHDITHEKIARRHSLAHVFRTIDEEIKGKPPREKSAVNLPRKPAWMRRKPRNLQASK